MNRASADLAPPAPQLPAAYGYIVCQPVLSAVNDGRGVEYPSQSPARVHHAGQSRMAKRGRSCSDRRSSIPSLPVGNRRRAWQHAPAPSDRDSAIGAHGGAKSSDPRPPGSASLVNGKVDVSRPLASQVARLSVGWYRSYAGPPIRDELTLNTRPCHAPPCSAHPINATRPRP